MKVDREDRWLLIVLREYQKEEEARALPTVVLATVWLPPQQWAGQPGSQEAHIVP